MPWKEGVFVAGAAVLQWYLRDGLKGIRLPRRRVETFAARSDPEQPIVICPAFFGRARPTAGAGRRARRLLFAG